MINSGPTGGKLTCWGRQWEGGGKKVRMPRREVEDNGASTGGARPSGCSRELQTTWNLFSLKLTTQECSLSFFEAFWSAFIPSFSHCRLVLTRRFAQVHWWLTYWSQVLDRNKVQCLRKGCKSAPRRPFTCINLCQIKGSLPVSRIKFYQLSSSYGSSSRGRWVVRVNWRSRQNQSLRVDNSCCYFAFVNWKKKEKNITKCRKQAFFFFQKKGN